MDDQSFPEKVTDQAAEVGKLYPAVYRKFRSSWQSVPGSEVTPRMLGLLHLLAHEGPLTLGELAGFLDLQKATITELVDRVEARNLTSRIRDDRDRRRVFIGLTNEGKKLVERLGKILQDEKLVRAMELMTAENRKKLIEGLRALLAAEQEVQDE